jgi:F-type H+-transporting ATPase subunit b
LYWALKKLLFKPVSEFMENRTNKIENSLKVASQKNEEADKLKNEYQNQLQTAREQADGILKEAQARAAREYDSMLAQAKAETQDLLAKSRADIERERQQMIKEIKNQVATLALAAASKVIEANMDNDKNRALVDKFIDEEGAA